MHKNADYKNYNPSTSDNQTEQLTQVDELDTVIGPISRKDCHNETTKPWHRSTHAYLFNPNGELFLSQRSLKKDTAAGMWTVSAAGHVCFGDTYESTILKEIDEELKGVVDTLEMIDKLKIDYGSEREIIGIFAGILKKEPVINPEEVAQIKAFNLAEIIETFNKGKFDLSGGSRDTFKHTIQTKTLINFHARYFAQSFSRQ